MGSMGSCLSDTDPALQLTQVIEAEIHNDRNTYQKAKKILFLGSAGSGKSTLFKQLRMIHGVGFDDSDREDYIKHIHSQIINEMKLAIQVYIGYNHRIAQKNNALSPSNDDTKSEEEYEDELIVWDNIELHSETLQNAEAAQLVLEHQYVDRLEPEIASAIKQLWDEPIIKEIYALRSITCIETSSAHFWDKIDEIGHNDYLPSTEDILLCRLKTTGLHEQHFNIKGEEMHIIDVGGQHSQRRKWIHCFEHVVAVIFIASLSCYDEILTEDNSMRNSMTDQLKLFKQISNNQMLTEVAMILFLNKADLFEQKYSVDQIPLSKCVEFEDFVDDDWSAKKAKAYIVQEFERLAPLETKNLYTHLTTATDKNNIQRVFADVQEIIISISLAQAGLIDE